MAQARPGALQPLDIIDGLQRSRGMVCSRVARSYEWRIALESLKIVGVRIASLDRRICRGSRGLVGAFARRYMVQMNDEPPLL